MNEGDTVLSHNICPYLLFGNRECFANNIIFINVNFKLLSGHQEVFGFTMKILFALFHVKHHLPIFTKIEAMSLGETPEILDA